MNIREDNNNIIITKARDFDLRHIFDCGQCFRFNRIGENTYIGTAFKHTVTVSQKDDEVVFYNTSERDFYNIWYKYFDLERDYSQIKRILASDEVMKKAISYGEGIRILNQELWETTVSFIISASNNIPRIKGIIERLCKAYGDEIEYMGKTYNAFPEAEVLSELDKEDLSVIRAGFRDKYILDAARRFAGGELSHDKLRTLDTQNLKKSLMTVNGIGNKVADCILLFGMQRTDSFPVDVWIKRIMEYCYFDAKEQTKEAISEFAHKKFGSLSGFAQQYLFFYARENKIGLD